VTPSPFFSIIVPTYERRGMVCEAVRALGRLSYEGPIEIIVVVDGSRDGTAAALKQVDCPFPLQVIEQGNSGQAAARNRGAAEAAGEFLLFLDDDMICEPDLVRQHARSHQAGADAVTGEIPLHPDSHQDLVTKALERAASWKRAGPISAFDVYSGNLSVRREVFRSIGGFDEAFTARGYGGEDLDLGLRLMGSYDLRHNGAAVAWQKSLIGPFEHMRRARRIAASDLRLIAKHPGITAELLENRGAPTATQTSLGFRLSRVPLLPGLAGMAVGMLAKIARRTPFRSHRLLARLYFTARTASYWSAFQTRAGKLILSDRRPQ
jgi:glycosyltransferase involved in cell wall biosynthesis